MFLGSDGGVIRTNGTYTDISGQCDTRGLSGVFLSDCHAWLSRIPTRLEPINSGLGTLQMYSIAVSHQDKNLAITGTQDNGSLNFSGSDKWLLGVTGDGGDAGFDAANDNTSFHTYYTGWLDVNFRGDDPKTWLWVGDQFFPGPPAGESIRMYPPTIADLVTPGTIFEGASHVWRTQDWGGDRVFVSKNADGPAASVTFSCIDTAAQPTRFPSSVSVDESNPNHAIVTYSGYSTSTPGIPGHVYDVVFDPVAGTATWTDISYDLGDQPILDSAFDSTPATRTCRPTSE
jgi:hypothetical protein